MTFAVNPFVSIQESNGVSSLILPREDGMTVLAVSDSDHPLFGIANVDDLLERTPRLSDRDLDMLMDARMLSNSPFDRTAMLNAVRDRINAPHKLDVTINPTMRCNNACLYCYQEHRRQPSMSPADWTALERHVLMRLDQGVRELHVGVMGGEPTLALRPLTRFLRRIGACRETRNVRFTCALTTNGRLLAVPGLADNLVRAGVTHVQLTLDGPAQVHDRIRPSLSGKPTHAQTLAGIRALTALAPGPSLRIRTNHTRDSVAPETLKEHLQSIREAVGARQDVTVSHERAADLGGHPCQEILLTKADFTRMLPDIEQATVRAGLRLDVSGHLAGSVCYAGRTNHFACYPGGVVRKCTVSMDPENEVGRLLPDGTLVRNERFNQWTDSSLDHPSCQNCKAALQCLGNACPARRLATNRPACHPRFFQNIPL